MKLSSSFRSTPLLLSCLLTAGGLVLGACDDGGSQDDVGGGGSEATGGSGAGTGGAGTSTGGAALGGGENGGAGGEGLGGIGNEPVEPRSCSSEISPSDFGVHGELTIHFVPLCELGAPVRHVRIDGLLTPATHASAQVFFGAAAAPSSTNPTPGQGELKVMVYGGGAAGPSGSLPPNLSVVFAGQGPLIDEDATWAHTSSSICFDLFVGSEVSPPHVVVWRDGIDGADCADFETLTLDNAAASQLWWDGELDSGAVTDSVPYFRQTSQSATVTLVDETALDESELPPYVAPL